MAKVGDNINAESARWTFSGDVASSFETHILKSVPLYSEAQNLILNLSDYFVKNNSVVYDMGCSTGNLAIQLAQRHIDKSGLRIFGVDSVREMIEFASRALKEQADIRISDKINFLHADLLSLEIEKSDYITSCYTMQFIPPRARQSVIDAVYTNLNWGGALVLLEKVRAPDARFQDISNMLYNEFKLNQGFKPEDIFNKTRSLTGVMEPFSTQGNLDMLKRAGFSDVTTIHKFICFEGYLAIK